MNSRKTILTASLAAVLTVSLAFAPALAAGSYTVVKTFQVLSTPASDSVTYKVTTTAPIPKQANDYISNNPDLPLTVLGYGWLDVDTVGTDGYVTGVFDTIHPAFTDSTFATGDKWHGHTGRVAPSTTDPDVLCLIHLESPAFSHNIAGATLTLNLSSADATVGPTTADAATSFTLRVNADHCPPIEVPVLSETAGMIPIEVVAPAP